MQSVGIGTTSPNAPLEVLYTAPTYTSVTGTTTGYGLNVFDGTGGIFWSADMNHSIWLRVGRDGTVNTTNYYQYGAHRFYTSGDISVQSLRMIINSSGNVGIGTASPSYTLDVNGSFRASGSSASVSINSAGLLVPTGAGGVATNTAVGASAMNANTTGAGNTAVGASALPINTTGVYNTAAGWQAMCLNTTGSYNTAVGTSALYQNTTGGGNTAVGYQAMVSNSTGQNNVCLGYNSGFDALVTITTQSNYVVLGNNSTATLYCKTSAINTSDARDKTNVESIAVGLDYVRKLKPVTFNFDDRGWYPEGQAPDGSKACSIHRLGFLAQDILAAEQELGLPFNHVVNTDFPEKLGIAPTNLIPILVKAIQELEQSLATATANISSLEQSLATVTANISSPQPPSAPANPQSSP